MRDFELLNMLGLAVAVGGGDGVLAMEAHGAAQFAHSDTLPLNRSGATEEQLVEMGFVLGKPLDEVLQEAKRPEGWSVRRSESDPRHMVLVDQNGNERATIFLKTTSYDYYGNCHFKTRYVIQRDWSVDDRTLFVADTTDGARLMTCAEEGTRENADQQREECAAYLNANYPDWASPVAYWGVSA